MSREQIDILFRGIVREQLGIDTNTADGGMRVIIVRVNKDGVQRMRAEITTDDNDIYNIIADVDYGMQLISINVFARKASLLIPIPSFDTK